MTKASVLCPAKVNLCLRILERERSGWHKIQTCFQAVGLWDKVTVRTAGSGIAFRAATAEWAAPELGDLAAELGPTQDNTVVRAAQEFFETTGIAPSVSLELAKAIPAGTGLGGGSSDAAGTLLALSAFYHWPLGRKSLAEVGARIGSDVAFFCRGAPSAVGLKWGEALLPYKSPPPASLALVVPRERVKTADAYREASAALALPQEFVRMPELKSGDWSLLGAMAMRTGNDFERTAFRRTPVLADYKDALADAGALAAGLTGSGSALFGVFGAKEAAQRAADRLADMEGVVAALVVPSLDAMPEPEVEEAEGVEEEPETVE